MAEKVLNNNDTFGGETMGSRIVTVRPNSGSVEVSNVGGVYRHIDASALAPGAESTEFEVLYRNFHEYKITISGDAEAWINF